MMLWLSTDSSKNSLQWSAKRVQKYFPNVEVICPLLFFNMWQENSGCIHIIDSAIRVHILCRILSFPGVSWSTYKIWQGTECKSGRCCRWRFVLVMINNAVGGTKYLIAWHHCDKLKWVTSTTCTYLQSSLLTRKNKLFARLSNFQQFAALLYPCRLSRPFNIYQLDRSV